MASILECGGGSSSGKRQLVLDAASNVLHVDSLSRHGMGLLIESCHLLTGSPMGQAQMG